MAHLDLDQCAHRYPRLLRAVKWAACLSHTEAAATLRDIRDVCHGYLEPGYLKWGGGEAVAHFGGPQAVITAAIRIRHVTRKPRV